MWNWCTLELNFRSRQPEPTGVSNNLLNYSREFAEERSLGGVHRKDFTFAWNLPSSYFSSEKLVRGHVRFVRADPPTNPNNAARGHRQTNG
jgi:hypothetical protein